MKSMPNSLVAVLVILGVLAGSPGARAEDHVVDPLRLDAGSAQERVEHVGAQVRRVGPAESTATPQGHPSSA